MRVWSTPRPGATAAGWPWLVAMVGWSSACSAGAPDPLGTLDVRVEGDSILLSRPLNHDLTPVRLERDVRIASLPLPGDVAALPDGAFAVVDRLDASVTLFDRSGARMRSFAREGEGPGELEAPYALTWADGAFGVWDRRGRLTTFRPDGTVLGTNESGARGDGPALWQRWPLTEWAKPMQLSREDPTRRLGPLGDHVGLLLRDGDERFDPALRGEGPVTGTYRLVRFDTLARPVDTLVVLDGPPMTLATPGSEARYAMARERPYAARPMWAAGSGWVAWGHGATPGLTVRTATRTLHVRWPEDGRPLGDPEWTVYHEWRFEAARRLTGDRDQREWMGIRIPWRQLREEVAAWQADGGRPQMAGVLGYGPCLALLGFRPSDGPHAESRTAVILDLASPGRYVVVRVEAEPGFLSALGADGLFHIAVEEDGSRVVERYGLPDGWRCVGTAL